jgi:hypothetical protein
MVEKKLQELIDALQGLMSDARKADKGNKSAGTRVRVGAQAVVHGIKELRSGVQSHNS